jgi:stage II sporulation protein D
MCGEEVNSHIYMLLKLHGEDTYSQYSSKVILSKEEMVSKVKEYHGNFEIDFNEEDSIKVLEYTEGGRVGTLKLGNLRLSGVEVRNIFGLRSARFEVLVEESNVVFNVVGYGHGVGMSQTGADAMARAGSGYEEILKHFYRGVEVTDI